MTLIGKEEVIILNVIGRLQSANKYYALFNTYLRLEIQRDFSSIIESLVTLELIVRDKREGVEEYSITDVGRSSLKENFITSSNRHEYESVASNMDFLMRVIS